MNTHRLLLVLSFACAFGATALSASAQDPAALAADSESYCASTIVPGRLTAPALVVAKVDEACALLAAEGPAAFPQFQGSGSRFIFEGTYLWIHTLDESEMLMHPIKHKMVGNKLVSLKDAKGKRFFVVMNDLVREKGSGWVGYLWPKPGSKDVVAKVSYVKRCRMANGVEVVVGCGLYHFDDTSLASLDVH